MRRSMDTIDLVTLILVLFALSEIKMSSLSAWDYGILMVGSLFIMLFMTKYFLLAQR